MKKEYVTAMKICAFNLACLYEEGVYMIDSNFFRNRNDKEQTGLANMIFPVVLAMSGCLVSCDKAHTVDKHQDGDPVLAVVGGDEITLSAVKAELANLDVSDNGDTDQQRQKQVLEALIDRDVVAHDAMRWKVDRDPAVVDAFNREKAKILVKAYLRELAETIPKPSQEEIDSYYKDHQALYSDRKLFKADELTISTAAGRQQVRAMSDAGNSMRQILLWLDEHNVPYTLKRSLITGDMLPPGLAEMSNSLANGKPFIVDRETDFKICAMTVFDRRPQSEDAVKQQIEHQLIDQKAHDELAANVTRLRTVDGVVYTDTSRTDRSNEPVAVSETSMGNNSYRHTPLVRGVAK
jgi:peptidyl-prolyl cis-trans isomerase C